MKILRQPINCIQEAYCGDGSLRLLVTLLCSVCFIFFYSDVFKSAKKIAKGCKILFWNKNGLGPTMYTIKHIIKKQFCIEPYKCRLGWEWLVLEGLATPPHCSSAITC